MQSPAKTLVCAALLAAGLHSPGLRAETLEITANVADTELRDDGTKKHAGGETMRVGGDSGTTDSNGMFPFALPVIPEGEAILSANIRVYLAGVSNKPGTADAYILPARSTPTFDINDFYQGAFDGDPDATALQDDLWTLDYPAGHYLLSDEASERLRQFIIDQYANGAQAGDYVIFRLSPSRDNETSYYFYTVATANNSTVENRPTLIIETFDGNYTPVVEQSELQSVNVGSSISFNISGTDENPEDELTFSSDALPSFVTLQDNDDNTATLTATPTTGDAGLYTFEVTVSDGARSSTGSVSIVVIGAGGGAGVPAFDPVDPVVIDQGEGLTVDITATDADDTSITLSAVNVPPFATFTDNGDLTASLVIDTWYNDPAGDYTVYIIAQDDDSHIAVTTVSISLGEVTFAPGYYCDPERGDISNDGSARSPWPGLAQVMAVNKSFQPGDVIYLRDGYHGEPTVNGTNADYVYIRPAEGHSPKLAKLTLNGAYWDVGGLSISRSYAPTYSKTQMVNINGTHNIVHDCDVFAMPSLEGWTLAEFTTYMCNGVGMGGTYNTVENCRIVNIAFGVQTATDSSFLTIRGNHIQNFSGDGIRVLGNDQLVEYNYIADNYNIDDNHDDGIQGWSVAEGQSGTGTGVTARMTIRGNYIIETTDPTREWQGPLQGIGLFDGMFEDWIIENNVIFVNQWHGISIYGARRCHIINNTVLDQDMNRDPGPTWIGIYHHKKYASAAPVDLERYRSQGNIVANNLCTATQIAAGTSTEEANHVLRAVDFVHYFMDYAGGDLRLLATAPAVNAGVAANAPATDIVGNNRTGLPDLGAYEYVAREWAGYPSDNKEWTNTQGLIGWVYTRYAPWVYHAESKTWIYLRADDLTTDGAWAYVSGLVPANSSPVTNDGMWAGYPVVNGWMSTSIGDAFRANGPWVYFNLLHTWTVAPGEYVTPSGTWVYVVRGDMHK